MMTPTSPPRPDAGFTLVELLTAMSIFLIIMGIVSTAVVNGYRTIQDVGRLSDVQAQQQNALLWTTRLLRYADNPVEGTTPSPWTPLGGATVTNGHSALTFYTYSGTGPVDRVPYKAELLVDGNGDLVSRVTTPTYVTGYGYCWLRADNQSCTGITEDVNIRILVNATDEHAPSLTLTYQGSGGVASPAPVNTDLATWRTWASGVSTVTLRIGDDGQADYVEQTVGLVNPR